MAPARCFRQYYILSSKDVDYRDSPLKLLEDENSLKSAHHVGTGVQVIRNMRESKQIESHQVWRLLTDRGEGHDDSRFQLKFLIFGTFRSIKVPTHSISCPTGDEAGTRISNHEPKPPKAIMVSLQPFHMQQHLTRFILHYHEPSDHLLSQDPLIIGSIILSYPSVSLH